MRDGSTTQKLVNVALVLLAGAVFAFTITILFVREKFFGFLESMLAADHQITNPGAVILNIYLLFFSCGIVLILLKGLREYAAPTIRLQNLPAHVKGFYATVAVVLLSIFLFKRNDAFYDEDGVLENITTLLAFGSSLIFLYLAVQYKFAVQRLFFLLLAAFTMFFGLEEISYGQRIFGWETTGYMLEANRQQESNLHNLFNEYFDLAYILINGLIAAIFFYRDLAIRLLQSVKPVKNLATLIPSGNFFHTGYVFLFLLLYTYVLDRGGETMEIIFALTLFFYAVDMSKKVRKPAATEPVAVNVRQGSN